MDKFHLFSIMSACWTYVLLMACTACPGVATNRLKKRVGPVSMSSGGPLHPSWPHSNLDTVELPVLAALGNIWGPQSRTFACGVQFCEGPLVHARCLPCTSQQTCGWFVPSEGGKVHDYLQAVLGPRPSSTWTAGDKGAAVSRRTPTTLTAPSPFGDPILIPRALILPPSTVPRSGCGHLRHKVGTER